MWKYTITNVLERMLLERHPVVIMVGLARRNQYSYTTWGSNQPHITPLCLISQHNTLSIHRIHSGIAEEFPAMKNSSTNTTHSLSSPTADWNCTQLCINVLIILSKVLADVDDNWTFVYFPVMIIMLSLFDDERIKRPLVWYFSCRLHVHTQQPKCVDGNESSKMKIVTTTTKKVTTKQ